MDALTAFGNNFVPGSLCIVAAFYIGRYSASGLWPWSKQPNVDEKSTQSAAKAAK